MGNILKVQLYQFFFTVAKKATECGINANESAFWADMGQAYATLFEG